MEAWKQKGSVKSLDRSRAGGANLRRLGLLNGGMPPAAAPEARLKRVHSLQASLALATRPVG